LQSFAFAACVIIPTGKSLFYNDLVYLWLMALQEKSLLTSTKVDAKDKKLLQKTFFVSTFWLTHSDAITRVA
jgi:hypothetical protein